MSNLGIRTPLSNIPIIGDIFFKAKSGCFDLINFLKIFVDWLQVLAQIAVKTARIYL